MSNEVAGRVRVGGIFAAVARAIGAAPGLFLLVWVVRIALGGLVPLLRAQDPVLMTLETWLTVLSWACSVALAMVSGLLIRWLLGPRRGALGLDVGLAVYVILISASHVPSWLLTQALRHKQGASGPILAADFGWLLAMAALALWPVALMMGDPIKLRRAVQLMAPAYLPWIVTMIILALPALVWAPIPALLLHQLHPGLGERMVGVALSAFTSTIATFALAFIYARRVRGAGLRGADDVGYAPQAA
jgi:hypothetical protein